MRKYDSQNFKEIPAPQPTTWIVEGLLKTYQKRPSLFCGLAEVGKSTLAVQLAIAVSQGRPFLGRETQKSKVIFWKAEDSEQDAIADFRKAGWMESDPLVLLLPEPDDNNLECLENALAEHPGTRLVIIETILDFLSIPDSNSTESVKAAMKAFNDTIVEKYPDCAFLLLHHFNKGDVSKDSLSILKINGSHAFATTTATKIFLHRVSDSDPRRYVYASVRRGKELEPTYLNFDAATNTSVLASTLYQEKTIQRQMNRETKADELDSKILHTIDENPGLSKNLTAEKVGGNRQKALLRIAHLVQMRFLVEVEDASRSGNPAKRLYCKGHEPAGLPDGLTLNDLTVLEDFDCAEDKAAFFNAATIEEKRLLDEYRPDQLPVPF